MMRAKTVTRVNYMTVDAKTMGLTFLSATEQCPIILKAKVDLD
jgi:hypothetical protein